MANINLLVEFEKRYKGDASQTESICEAIAIEFNLDPEFVKDHVYINRYETITKEEKEIVEDAETMGL